MLDCWCIRGSEHDVLRGLSQVSQQHQSNSCSRLFSCSWQQFYKKPIVLKHVLHKSSTVWWHLFLQPSNYSFPLQLFPNSRTVMSLTDLIQSCQMHEHVQTRTFARPICRCRLQGGHPHEAQTEGLLCKAVLTFYSLLGVERTLVCPGSLDYVTSSCQELNSPHKPWILLLKYIKALKKSHARRLCGCSLRFC